MSKYLDEKQSPIVITQNGGAKAVMVDINTYKTMLDTMTMLKLIHVAEKDVQNEDLADHDEVFATLRNEIRRDS